MKQTDWFGCAYIVSCLGSLALAVGINVLGNSADLFPSSFFPAMNERAWKTRRLDAAVRDCRPPQIIILGSSRVMAIEPKYVEAITGKTAFNYGVYTATPTDYLTQLRYLIRKGCRPEVVIVGVEESAFYYTYTPWDMETLSHLGLFREMPYPEKLDILAQSLATIDLGMTKGSLSRLLGRKKSVPRSIEDADDFLLEDGYVLYVKILRKQADGSFNLAARIAACVNGHGRKSAVWRLQESLQGPPNPRKLDHFDKFLSLARAEGFRERAPLSIPGLLR